MKRKALIFLLPFSVFAGETPAQENSLTAEQQEEISSTTQEIKTMCSIPTSPAIPDGKNTTSEELISAQKDIKAYISAGNTFLACLDDLENSWADDATPIQKAVITGMYNQMVDALQGTAKDFNTELGVYKEEHSG